MPSLRNQFKVNDFLWNKLFLPSYHVIVVIGYNETNQSICYNDPNAGFYGDGSYGDYAWINLSNFRKAHEKNNDYCIDTYKQINQPCPKKDAFEKAFRKNIENLTGDFPEYWWACYGINASKKMQMDFSPGKNNSQETSHMYKEYGDTGVNFTIINFMHRLCSILYPHKPNIFDIIMAGEEIPFEDIAAGKNCVADYLQNCLIHPSLCKNQSNLLRKESEKWHELSKYYEIFLRKGIFLSDLRAALLMNKMEKLMKNIIDIEEVLIAQSYKE
jgi:hypothetical protein